MGRVEEGWLLAEEERLVRILMVREKALVSLGVDILVAAAVYLSSHIERHLARRQ
jgi:hypothetical protein